MASRKSASHEALLNPIEHEPQGPLPGGLKVPEDTPTAGQGSLADQDRSREYAKQIAQRVVSAPVAGPLQTNTTQPTQPSSDVHESDVTLNNDQPSGSTRKRQHSTAQFIPYDQKETPTQSTNGGHHEYGNVHGSEHAQKRMRSSDWPLKPTTLPQGTNSNTTPRGKDSKISLTAVPVAPIVSARTSRFIEGSMNDRVSTEPPSEFMNGEDVLERFLAEAKVDRYFLPAEDADKSPPGGLKYGPNQSKSRTASNDSKPRESGIYRLGRSIFSAFNPVNIWNDVCSKWKEAAKEFDPVAIREREQKAQAEEIYAKMKENGSLYTHGASHRDKDGKVIAVAFYPDRITNPRASVEANVDRNQNVLRDSGIDVDSYRSSVEGRRASGISTESGKLEPPAARGGIGCSESPTPDIPSAQKSLLKFKKPSMPNLKKIRSELQLSSSKRRVDGDASSLVSDRDTPTPTSIENRAIRKEPSKKDLQMQQKLTKRVSDLESKLEAARRELNQVLGEAPSMQQAVAQSIVRKPFVPGALSSLPSEGVLAAQVSTGTTEVEEDTPECRKAKAIAPESTGETSRPLVSGHHVKTHEKLSQGEEIAQSPAPTKSKKKPNGNKIGKRRRNGGGAEDGNSRYKPDVADDDDDAEWEAAKTKVQPKKKHGRPKKSLDLGESTTPAVVDIAPVSKRRKTNDEAKENVSAATGELHGPRISDFVVEKTTTEYKSVMQLNQHGPAVLGRPRSVTPSTRSRGHRRSTSPPPSLSYSRPATRQSSASEDPISIMPEGEIPPGPKMPKGLDKIVRLASVDFDPVDTRAQVNVDPEKQASSIEKDDFEWPEDVF
ncbi:MAG: hypothetical protein M1835_000817 [Candelina submexicana]|nr:MAG: hypothetical protein M1835_000817 [Candelina submexicana]